MVLARGRLGEDLVARLAADPAFGPVVSVNLASVNLASVDRVAADHGASSAQRVDVLDPGAPQQLALILGDVAPQILIDVSVSETEMVPSNASSFDRTRSSVVAGALRRWAARGGAASRVVLLSSTAVYGLADDGPLLFEEDRAGSTPARGLTDAWGEELERAEGRIAEACLAVGSSLLVLRAASVVGGPIWSPITAWLQRRTPIRAAGWDPPVQVLHYSDLLEALVLAVHETAQGVVNVAGRGVIALSHCAHLAGAHCLVLPGPLADRMVPSSFGGGRLRMRCIADGRRARQVLGFTGARAAQQAFK